MNAGVHPASHEQERAWINARLSPGGPGQGHVRAFRLSGRLDVARLERALGDLALRHAILATRLADEDGHILQVAQPQNAPSLEQHAVSGSAQRRVREARAVLARFAREGFDAEQGPLVRVILLRLAAADHVLAVCLHEAVCDGGDTCVALVRELLRTYRTGAELRRAPRPATTYADYVRRQRSVPESALHAQRAYWTDYLSAVPPLSSLPSRRSRAEAEAPVPDPVRRKLAPAAARALVKLGRRLGVRPKAVLLAALASLLHRYTSSDQLVVGHVASTRGRYGPRIAFGNCSNLVAFRADLSETTTFELLAQEAERRLDEAEARLDLPFQQVMQALGAMRDSSAHPLFQVLLREELETPPIRRLSSPELAVDHFDEPSRRTGLDLEVTVRRSGRGPELVWEYSAELFERREIEQFARHFEQLLAATCREPSVPVGRIEYLARPDHNEIRSFWNTSRVPYREATINTLIDEQAERTPEVHAVEFGDRALTYRALVSEANRLAARLLAAGVHSGQMVGLCLERSIEMIVAMVASWKAGGTVLPLDSAYPTERLRFMLEDSGAKAVVTSAELLAGAEHLNEILGSRSLVFCDRETDFPEDAATNRDGQGSGLADLAYCIYTSGSTGNPKGVAVDHAALCNLISWHRSTWLVGAGVRTLLFSPISFDVAFHEIVVGLSTGATLVQVEESTRSNALALLEFARRAEIAKWYMPFVTLQQIAQAALKGEAPTALRELIVGGEPLRITPEVREFARRTGCVIHNHYGSTECVDVTSFALSGDVDAWPELVPIGRANVHNMNAFILDRWGQLVPPGVVGELYAAGDCLARGYLNRPELNAERFLPNPFGTQGSRLYRLGDLGRYLSGGEIECLGRADQQIKIRGYRVEPGEIESTLAKHPRVAECVVTVKRGPQGGHRIVAYIVPPAGVELAQPSVLRGFLAERLPEYMLPTAIVTLETLPLTPSGKVAVRRLPEPAGYSGDDAAGTATAEGGVGVRQLVTKVWQELLNLDEIDVERTFFELGGDSLLLVRAHQRLSEALALDLHPVTLFRHPTVASLADHLADRLGGGAPEPQGAAETRRPGPNESDAIAVVGMACRAPGARDLAEFWANLRAGVESIADLAGEPGAADPEGVSPNRRLVRRGGVLPNIDSFDAAFFDYSAAEAATIDPQQRMFLECSWQAMEDAGLEPGRNIGRVGVYAGCSMSTYLINNVLPNRLGHGAFLSHRYFDAASDLRVEQGNARDHLPTRISYKLDFNGPSVNVQSTCSTSLVAVHLACQALRAGECDVALAGGVALVTPQDTGYLWQEGMMLSPDGHCRPFDADADGTVFGNGLGAVALKPLSAALKDRDRIYALVRGSAVNNDGGLKVDYSGPSVEAQAEVIVQAQASAGVSAADISYVEAHGTATVLGDPIEVAGLTEAFRRTTDRAGQYCALGSVKSNIGHLDEAAGVFGLIKTALALFHRELPPTLHFRRPNPRLGLEQTPFFVNADLRAWDHVADRPRRAGVSSFGMGGTNCHVVLEEAPARPDVTVTPDRGLHVLAISAKSPAALRANVHRYLDHLTQRPELRFADVCFSAATGRKHFRRRLAVVAADALGAASQLESFLQTSDRESSATAAFDADPPVAFLFTGQGTQYVGMGQRLHETQPVFREALDTCDEILRPILNDPLTDLLFQDTSGRIDDTAIAQPALFATGYALDRLWRSWGVAPSVVIGHSLGEYVAACSAGVFSLEDGLRLVAERGRLMHALRDGSMAQVHAPVERVRQVLADYSPEVSIAAVNGPEATVISGRRERVDEICARLRQQGALSIPLSVSRAFHSPLMGSMLGSFAEAAATIRYSAPRVPIVSNITGALAAAEEIASAGYWVRHVMEPVDFAKGVRALAAQGIRAFVEIGPQPTLISFGRACLPDRERLWLPSLSPRDREAAVASLGKLYAAGAKVDWSGFDAPFGRSRVQVPGYAFQRERHWLESGTVADQATSSASRSAPRGDAAPGLWGLYAPEWRPIPQPPEAGGRGNWLIAGSGPKAERMFAALRRMGHDCVRLGAPEEQNEAQPDEEARLRAALKKAGEPPSRLVVIAEYAERPPPQAAERVLLAAQRLLGPLAEVSDPLRMWLVVEPEGETGLAHSVLSGLAPVINVEHPELNCAVIGLDATAPEVDLELAIRAMASAPAQEERLTIRAGRVEGLRLEPHPVFGGLLDSRLPEIRADRAYLITGGLGGLGLRVALAVAGRGPKRLLLLGRRGEVADEDLPIWRGITATGCRVDAVKCDVSDAPQLRAVLTPELIATLGGVFHCAGVVDDGILLNQTPARLAQVLAPKVHGAWLLHTLTREAPLDVFVMFSSSASLFGYGGQSGYAAANAFLDHLARHRQGLGLPGLSVSWGGWAETGMSARMEASGRPRSQANGEIPIPVDTGLALLAKAMGAGKPHLAVPAIDWTVPGAVPRRSSALLEAFVQIPAETPDQDQKPDLRAALRGVPPEEARAMLWRAVAGTVRDLMGGGETWPDPQVGFEELGLDSLGAVELRAKLQDLLRVTLPPTVAFDYPCIDKLSAHLGESHLAEDVLCEPETSAPVSLQAAVATAALAQPVGPSTSARSEEDPIAIVGMACRFPGAENPAELWTLLIEGRDAVRPIPADRWAIDDLYAPEPGAPGKIYVRDAALLKGIDRFDPAFFGISPREARSMDPRHRLILETAWEALESAGIDPSSLRGSDAGVFLGGDEFLNDYLYEVSGGVGADQYVATGSTLSFAAGRLSYKLGLHGPSMVLATACSSSLVALHAALQSLQQDECGMAIVGGAKLMFGPEETVQLCQLRALAPDGRSKAFSDDADGYGRGEGCAMVVLKRLSRAEADGDPILALVRSAAINHDGPSSGLTVPNGRAQTNLIRRALQAAGLHPSDISYVEAHGTGTPLGDPIEINALAEVYGEGRDAPLLVGSVKANIGHLEEAAGLAGLIKVVLAMQHNELPPQPWCARLSSKIEWTRLPVAVPQRPTAWPSERKLAGVSAFGMSGTNVHVLLESYQAPAPRERPTAGPLVFCFSARDERDLRAVAARFVHWADNGADPVDVAHTLHCGRRRNPERLAVVAADLEGVRGALSQFLADESGLSDVYRGSLSRADSQPRTPAAGGEQADGRRAQDCETLARRWCDGADLDWRDIYRGLGPRRIALPAYPFKRERLWPEGAAPGRRPAPPVAAHAVSLGDPATAAVNVSPWSTVQPTRKETPLTSSTPRDNALRDVLQALAVHVANLLGMQPNELLPDQPFEDLGADSLMFMRTSQFIRDRFGIAVNFQQLIEDVATLDELAHFVTARIAPQGARPTAAVAPPQPTQAPPPGRSDRSYRPVLAAQELSPEQAQFLAEFVEAYSQRTRGSKVEAERDRPFMANCRMPPFQPHTKELAYPILARRSKGSRFWDVDGNEYVDISMGYGVHLFGHQPDFVLDAVREQLDRGLHIGPQVEHAGGVARMLCELTGMSRVAFCNSGTEAVMAALRFARAATGRTKFVMFEGSYHGWSDGTLALPAGPTTSIAMARGIGAGAMEDVVVLEYGSDKSLETIAQIASELSAVLVEPVQSRRPDLQPSGFLHDLRRITRDAGAALIFDEVITGFRVHPGGAQAWCGVDADLVTYGKILGGGVPIGAVAGRAEFMDTVDGGQWRFGDSSAPSVPTTFFGGTFNKNPLAMAAAQAVLVRLQQEGAGLQADLAERVAWLADQFNAFCREEGFPLKVVHFSSLFRFIGEGEYSLQRFPLPVDLFFQMMAHKGVYILETRVCFLSTRHTQEDIRFVLTTAQECLRTLRKAGFFRKTDVQAAPPSLADRLFADAVLEESIGLPNGAKPRKEPQEVILTGATGFLGAYLLPALLRSSSARVHCLVRATSAKDALDRVQGNLEAYGCWDPAFAPRLAAVPSDLSEPRIGLSCAGWDELAERTDAIFHGGALVNSVLGYERLRAANVEGTRQLLRLSVHGRLKSFHHISSDAVFDAWGYHRQAVIYEAEPLAHADSLYGGGYAESKWVADKLIEQAKARGVPAFIYRPGMITGDFERGAGRLDDFFARFLKGVVQLGMAPEIDAVIDIAPVDYVARAIVEIARSAAPGTFHLTHPAAVPYQELVDALRRGGYEVRIVPYFEWQAALTRMRYEDGNALYPLLPVFTESTAPFLRRSRLDVTHASEATDLAPPPIADLLALYVARFAELGFFPPPVVRPRRAAATA